jgi:hypothetical protein
MFLAMILNRWSVSLRYSTLMLTPTLVGMLAGCYIRYFIVVDYSEAENTCFFLI